MSEQAPTIRVTENGPYLVSGPLPVQHQTIETDDAGVSVAWRAGETVPTGRKFALCRCGHSANKPFCDGSHERVHFDGTETASREPYLQQAQRQEGPIDALTDAEVLCSFARFCDAGGQIWNLVEEDSTQAAELAERESVHCPSGRLVTWRRDTGEEVLDRYEPSIGLVEDPTEEVSGPYWVRGSVQVIAADGTPYEVRRRVTLCRCGASKNKPFCDGSHASIGFTDA